VSGMEQNLNSAIEIITKQADLICHGNFEQINDIYEFADPEKNPENIVNLVESFGMMSVKLEAREFQLEKTIEELKDKNEQLEQSIKMRNHLNFVFMNTVALLSFFSFVLAVLKTSASGASATSIFIVSRLIEISILVSSIMLIVRSKLPLSEFGLTLKNLPRAIKESLLATVAAIVLCTFLKFILVRYHIVSDTSVLRFSNVGWTFAFYILVAPLQEFLGRGVVQGTLQRIVPGKYGWIMAIILTSLVFGTLHLYISTSFALASMIGSFLWGWLYLRHGTIAGISLSHFLIGLWLGVLGFL
jgi:membrane protease YdiL (CAAX protease family)